MIRSTLFRMINSFCYAIAIMVVVYTVMYAVNGQLPLLPEYRARFDSDCMALMVQLLLIGLMSAVLAGGAFIMELERLSLLAQSLIYFFISLLVWVSAAAYCWGFFKYPVSAVSLILSYLVSYTICWTIHYKTCKKSIADINEKLQELRQSEEEKQL